MNVISRTPARGNQKDRQKSEEGKLHPKNSVIRVLKQLSPIMTNEEYKKAFQILKEGLVENLAIYHERVTLLVQLTQFDINEKGVKFEARIVKPLNKAQAEKNRLFEKMISKQPISFGASYQFGMGDSPLLKGKKVGRPYCPFTLWLDPELSTFVMENGDEITKEIPQYILGNEDWRQVVGR